MWSMRFWKSISSSKSIKLVAASGEKMVTKYYIIFLLRDDKKLISGSFRVAFAFSSKLGNAIVRNLLKRRTRAILDQLPLELTNKLKDHQIFIIGRASSRVASFGALERDLRKAIGSREFG